jgi:glycosyltransferase involved in cell wall biosynthesis
VGRPLRVAIDVTSGVNQAAGVGRATRETVSALLARPDPIRYRLLYAREPTAVSVAGERWLASVSAGAKRVRVTRLPLPARWVTRLWLRLRLPVPAEVFTGPADVLIGPDFVAPPTLRARPIVTIHDLSYLVLPQYADPGLRRYLTAAVPRSLRRAAHVVAVSEATRQDVIRRLDAPPERVSVIYNGVDARFRPGPPAPVAALRARLGLPERFILTVGTLEPRKNHLTLIRAVARLRRELPDLTLVVAGRRGWLDQPIFDLVEQLQLQSAVRFLGGVADEDLPDLYRAATIMAYPAWHEGFGLPPLEAMACGAPVVASTASSLPEVCGQAALLVDPADDAALAAALARLWRDAALRRQLAAAGPRQAARFTWSATAERWVELVQRIGAGHE